MQILGKLLIWDLGRAGIDIESPPGLLEGLRERFRKLSRDGTHLTGPFRSP